MPCRNVDRPGGFRVVRIDNRDNGASTVLHHKGKPALPAMMFGIPATSPTRSTITWRTTRPACSTTRGDAAHVIGYSMGGMISQTMAIDHPDRVLSPTR